MTETKIIINKAESFSSNSFYILPHSDNENLSIFDKCEEDVESNLSFIVKERLHKFTNDLRRRTSQVLKKINFCLNF